MRTAYGMCLNTIYPPSATLDLSVKSDEIFRLLDAYKYQMLGLVAGVGLGGVAHLCLEHLLPGDINVLKRATLVEIIAQLLRTKLSIVVGQSRNKDCTSGAVSCMAGYGLLSSLLSTGPVHACVSAGHAAGCAMIVALAGNRKRYDEEGLKRFKEKRAKSRADQETQ